MDIRLILSRIRPGADWGWKGGSASDPANLVWRDAMQAQPTLQELEAEWTVIESEAATALTVKQQLKAAVNAVDGGPVSGLTNVQVRDMVEVLMAIMGGIDFQTRHIKPANQWDTAREILGI